MPLDMTLVSARELAKHKHRFPNDRLLRLCSSPSSRFNHDHAHITPTGHGTDWYPKLDYPR